MNTRNIRLPRQIEADQQGTLVLKMLSEDTRPLWQGSEVMVPFVELKEALASALRSANMAGLAVRGLQCAEERLEREERGLKLADKKQGQNREGRISRLLILSVTDHRGSIARWSLCCAATAPGCWLCALMPMPQPWRAGVWARPDGEAPDDRAQGCRQCRAPGHVKAV